MIPTIEPIVCKHEYVIKDGASDKETFKIEVCLKCAGIGKVTPRLEKPKEKSVWDIKDKRIARMSAVKSAVEFVCASGGNVGSILSNAESFEKWIYREDL